MTLYNTLVVITVFQFLLYAVFLFSIRKGKRHSNTILAVFLLSKFLVMTNHMVFYFRVPYPHLYYWGSPFAFLWGPSLYYYVRSMIFKNFHFHSRHLIHAFPFAVCWIYFVLGFHLQGTEIKWLWIRSFQDQITIRGSIIVSVLHIQILVYMVLAVVILIRYRQEIKNQFAAVEKIKMSWLCFVLFGFITIWSLDLAEYVCSLYNKQIPLLTISPIPLLFFFATYVVFKGLRQPELFNGIDQKVKYEKSPLTKEEQDKFVQKITGYMKKEKPYLDPTLTLNDLARAVCIQPRYVSQVINDRLHRNFFDFVNFYRVEEAKQMLTTPNGKNILQILLDVGFNSKSVFNRVFKKYTRLTPREFRQKNMSVEP